jgi:hypothetical protein
MRKYMYILSLLIIGLSACKKEEPIGGTSVQDMSGEWWVQAKDADGKFSTFLGEDFVKIVTFNTSDNSTSQMWVDLTEFWGTNTPPKQLVQVKANVNTGDKTFSITNGNNVPDNGYKNDPNLKITIKNGKVITDGAVGPGSKQKTDAISLDVEFSDEPGTIYKLSGYHRTKFPDDDH